jgi:quercetin dioxygenase-like cupin family protein
MEIRRFGPGHRRSEGPPGTSGITGQVIWNDRRANVSELAFSRRAAIAPHDNPNTTLFIVVSGGGFVQVGDERTRINHGEAVVWPAGIPHGAYTDGSEMRAILVELVGANDEPLEPIEPMGAIESGLAADSSADDDGPAMTSAPDAPPAPPTVEPARGRLAERAPSRDDHDESEGEPW